MVGQKSPSSMGLGAPIQRGSRKWVDERKTCCPHRFQRRRKGSHGPPNPALAWALDDLGCVGILTESSDLQTPNFTVLPGKTTMSPANVAGTLFGSRVRLEQSELGGCCIAPRGRGGGEGACRETSAAARNKQEGDDSDRREGKQHPTKTLVIDCTIGIGERVERPDRETWR